MVEGTALHQTGAESESESEKRNEGGAESESATDQGSHPDKGYCRQRGTLRVRLLTHLTGAIAGSADY